MFYKIIGADLINLLKFWIFDIIEILNDRCRIFPI